MNLFFLSYSQLFSGVTRFKNQQNTEISITNTNLTYLLFTEGKTKVNSSKYGIRYMNTANYLDLKSYQQDLTINSDYIFNLISFPTNLCEQYEFLSVDNSGTFSANTTFEENSTNLCLLFKPNIITHYISGTFESNNTFCKLEHVLGIKNIEKSGFSALENKFSFKTGEYPILRVSNCSSSNILLNIHVNEVRSEYTEYICNAGQIPTITDFKPQQTIFTISECKYSADTLIFFLRFAYIVGIVIVSLVIFICTIPKRENRKKNVIEIKALS